MKILFAETIGLPKPAGDNDEGVGGFFKNKVWKPVVRAGKATGKALGEAGEATEKAIKDAAEWTKEKVKGD